MNHQTTKPSNHQTKPIWRWAGRLAIFAVLAVFAIVLASWIFIDWDEEGSEDFPGGVILRDSTGEIMRVTLGEGDVDCRPFYVADENDWIVKALVAVEDGEFWEHCGVRPLSIARAFFQNVFYRRRISGASTLTMQTVRLIHPHRKSYWRKWVEAIEAVKMEQRRSKIWILSQYLNRAPFGANFIGIESAAQGWFGKGAKDLGLGEAALLAAMVQAPSRFRPDRGGDKAFKRRDYVLERMMKLGMIDAAQAEGARSVRPVVRRIHRPFRHPYYCDFVLRDSCFMENGENHEARGTNHEARDITTPLDPDVQLLCESIVNDAANSGGYSVAAVVLRFDSLHDDEGSRHQAPGTKHQAPDTRHQAQGTRHQAQDTRHGVREANAIALACSGDYFDKSGGQVNTALAPRPAGSTLKPFLVALAFDLGIATPELRMNDAPIAYKGYRPANFDSSYRGLVTVRDALILSLNIPFVQMLERVGLERFGAYLRSLGFESMNEPDDKFGLGMAIGNVEVSLVELTRAYANFVHRASCIVPRAELSDDTGTMHHAPGTMRQAQSARSASASAYLVSEILSGQERTSAALGHIADVRSLPRFAWKTGTSSAYRDAWCVMWNPEYVIGVWAGHKRGGFGDKSLVGAKAAAPVAWRIARALYPQGDGPWFEPPPEIATREVCTRSGLPATPDCEETEDGYYIRGVSSPRLCDVCPRLNAQPSTPNPQPQTANCKLQTPLNSQPSTANCKLQTANCPTPSTQLAIAKPQDGAVFEIVEGMPQQRIVCEALGNAENAALWWFLDGAVAGRTTGRQTLIIEPTPGEHNLTCADSSGRTASTSFSVLQP